MIQIPHFLHIIARHSQKSQDCRRSTIAAFDCLKSGYHRPIKLRRLPRPSFFVPPSLQSGLRPLVKQFSIQISESLLGDYS